MTKITGYTALTTGFSVTDVVPIVDVTDTTMAPSGTTKKITLTNLFDSINSATDTNIKADGAQASGITLLAPNVDHVHPAGSWIPSDSGLLAANYPPWGAGANAITIAQSLYLLKIWIRQPFTATNLLLDCQTIAAGTSTQSFCGLWNSSGTLLTSSADIGSTFLSTGVKTLPFTTPQALTVGMGFVWTGFVFNMSVTQPKLRCATGTTLDSALAANFNLSAANFAAAINGTAVTALANITPSANAQSANSCNWWAGIT